MGQWRQNFKNALGVVVSTEKFENDSSIGYWILTALQIDEFFGIWGGKNFKASE